MLAQLKAHYASSIELLGSEGFNVFYKSLETRYKASPATFTSLTDKEYKQPLFWKDFQSMSLTRDSESRALHAYYNYPTHTAIRYLSKPNHWLAPNAVFTNQSKESGREACFNG